MSALAVTHAKLVAKVIAADATRRTRLTAPLVEFPTAAKRRKAPRDTTHRAQPRTVRVRNAAGGCSHRRDRKDLAAKHV